jgi:hypothetical protein
VKEEKKTSLAEPVARNPSPGRVVKSRKSKTSVVRRQESPAKSLVEDKSGVSKQRTDSENDHLMDLVDQLEDEVKRTAE